MATEQTDERRPQDRRTIVQMKCMQCGARDQAALTKGNGKGETMEERMGKLVLNACPKCKYWRWEFLGPDYFGVITEDKKQLERLFRQSDPGAITKSPFWSVFCALLDSVRVQAADGSLSNEWCGGCVNEPHRDNSCRCGCHAAWKLRVEMEQGAAA